MCVSLAQLSQTSFSHSPHLNFFCLTTDLMSSLQILQVFFILRFILYVFVHVSFITLGFVKAIFTFELLLVFFLIKARRSCFLGVEVQNSNFSKLPSKCPELLESFFFHSTYLLYCQLFCLDAKIYSLILQTGKKCYF